MEVLMASLEQIASDNAIAPLSPPELDPEKITMPEDGPLVYEFDVEVRPEFDLPEYKGLKLKRPTKTFNDADIQAEKKRFLAQFGKLEPKPGDSPAVELEDFIIADLKVTHDGKDLNNLVDMKLKVEKSLALSDGVAPEFGKQLTGAKAGDTRTVEIKISEQAANPELRGQLVKADFTIKKIEVMVLPELTDDMLKMFNVRTMAQFDELMASALERRLEYTQRQSAREEVFGLITSSSSWELPQDLLARQSKRILARRIMEMRNAGMSEEEIMTRQRLMTQDVLQSTAKALKEHFVLQKIADVEKIEIDEGDIDTEIETIAERNNESPRKVRARLEREDLIEALATELLERKALDLVLQNATYEDVPLKEDDAAEFSSTGSQAIPGAMQQPEASSDQPTKE
jgi:trigger factor